MNFYPFHIGDYAAHTRHLTMFEDLAYRRLIDAYYLNEKPFYGSPADIAKSIGMVQEIEEVYYILKTYFEQYENGWINKRCDEEIAKYHGKLEQASKAGKASAEARFNSRSTVVQPTKNQEPITKNHIKTIAPVGFNLFWDAYNKKTGKPNSIKEWKKINPDEQLLQIIVAKAKADKAAKPDDKYRKDPERWLKGQHWLDEVIIEQTLKAKELPLGTNEQIEQAYRVECGKDPALARFNSYFDMRDYIVKFREERAKA
jgi:uncharacterized protein YdaU (DUF1376 family)